MEGRAAAARPLTMRTLRLLSLSLLLGACAGPRLLEAEGLAGRRAQAPLPGRRLELDAEHYRLELELLPQERALRGRTTMRARALTDGLEAVRLDLVGLEVTGVWDGEGSSLGWEADARGLVAQLPRAVDAGAPVVLQVAYQGRPNRGLWFAPGPDPDHCFTQGECEDARRWFPCLDHPSDRATSELVVTMPASWTSMAGGLRLGRTVEGERAVERWAHHAPHPAYLETLVAGELAVVEHVSPQGVQAPPEVPVQYLGPLRTAALLQPNLGMTPDVLRFMGELTGRTYPYPKYATCAVDGFPFGGMENTSATTITTASLCDHRGRVDGGPEGLVVHEAAHQWFGDLLTCADWDEIWLNEGFATYCTHLWFEETRGEDELLVRARGLMAAAVAAEERTHRPMVHDVCVEPMDLFFSGHAYQGGAARLHHLRFVLGDEAFLRGIRAYVGLHENQAVHTRDLQACLEAASGLDLGRHFDQWLHAPGVPRFSLSWRWSEGVLRVRVAQTQGAEGGTPEAFATPIELEWRTAGGLHRQRVSVEAREEEFEVECASKPLWVRLDPHRWVPCSVEAPLDLETALLLANEAPDPAGRLDGLELLASRVEQMDEGYRRAALDAAARRLEADPVREVRCAAAALLGAARSAGSRDLLRVSALEGDEPAVRAAALDGLRAFTPDSDLFELAQRAFVLAPSWSVCGASLRLAAAADAERAARWFRELQRAPGRLAVDGPSAPLAQHLAGACSALPAPVAWELLGEWVLSEAAAPEGVPPLARIRALEVLTPQLAVRPSLRAATEALLGDHDPRLSRAAVQALVQLGDDAARGALAAHYPRTASPRERRAIEGLFPSSE